MRSPIYITEPDFERLESLLEGGWSSAFPSREYLDVLREELDRAEIVAPEEIPGDVITLGSVVRLEDLESGEVRTYTLVLPTQARTETSVSVLAPLGVALLGYREGDVIECLVPRGVRRVKVLEVLYQPERSVVPGHDHSTRGSPAGKAPGRSATGPRLVRRPRRSSKVVSGGACA